MNAEVTRLDNGFTVATETMSDLKSVAIALYVQAGSRHERNDQGGIAHFLEHMAFKGTKTRTASQISNTIENVGGMLNAYTSRDKTAYLVRVLSEDIAIATELLADIILNSIYDPKEIDLERKVILNEIRQYRDYPEDVVFEELQKMVYPDQPFGRPIIGTADLVSNYSRNDLKGYISEHYHPNKMILAVAGGIKHDEVTQLAEKFFGNLESKKTTPFEASSYQSGEYRKHKEVEQTQFVMAFEGPRLRDKMEIPALAYSVIMGGGSSSRLFAEAREKRGLCYSISAQCMPFVDTGIFIVHASTRDTDIEQLALCCTNELRNAMSSITNEEVERARTQIKVGILMAYENPVSRVERLGGMIANFGYVESIDTTSKRFDEMNRDNIEEFASNIVNEQDVTLAVYGPIDGAPSRSDLQQRLRL